MHKNLRINSGVSDQIFTWNAIQIYTTKIVPWVKSFGTPKHIDAHFFKINRYIKLAEKIQSKLFLHKNRR